MRKDRPTFDGMDGWETNQNNSHSIPAPRAGGSRQQPQDEQEGQTSCQVEHSDRHRVVNLLREPEPEY